MKRYFKYVILFLLFLSGSLFAQTPLPIYSPNFSSAGGWQINGNATIISSSYLRLTPNAGNQAGSAFWKQKISLPDDMSFSTYFTSKMTPGSRADGMTFCIQQASNNAGSAGGGLGYQNMPGKSIAIEYDTYNNGEINNNHIALDINGALHGSTNVVASPVDLADGTMKYNWIEYNGATQILQVRISNTNVRPTAATLSVSINLASNFVGISDFYFGFTAATGGATEEHSVYSALVAPNSTPLSSTGSYSQGVASIVLTSSNAISCTALTSTITVTTKDVNGVGMPTNLVMSSDLGGGTLSAYTLTTNSSGVGTIVFTSNAGTLASNTIRAEEPNVGAYGTVVVTKTGTVPIGGTLATTTGTICTGGTAQLTLSGQTGNINKWQRSTDNTNWNDIANTTTSLSETVYGGALNMDGSNDYISLPKPSLNSFTIEYWVKTTQSSLTGSQWYQGNGIVDAEVGGATSDFGTSMLNGKLAFGVGLPDVTIQSTTSINTGNWVHVAATWDGSTGAMKIYINGVLEASTTGATGNRAAPPSIRIGSIQTGIQYFNGTIDELRIWNVVRSQSDIQSNMNSEIGTSSSLVEYYRFNQGNLNGTNTVTSLTDTSGNNNTGTLYNFALTGTTSNWTNGVITTPGTYYYRVEIQATGCTVVTYSSVVSISVLAPPTGGSVSSSVGTTGTLTLSGNTGTVVKWQRSIDNGATWTDIVNTTTTYSYSGQTDGTQFRAVVTNGSCTSNSTVGIVTLPFTYTTYVYNSENSGLFGIPVKIYYKLKTDINYTLYSTVNTDVVGLVNFSVPYSINSYNFRLVVDNLVIPMPTVSDVNYITAKIIQQSFNSKDYYRFDTNNNNVLNISDCFLIYYRISGGIGTWTYLIPSYRIFNESEWNTINASNSNLKITYPGTQSIIVDNLISGSTTRLYLVRTGYKQ
jgi:hypothetical protein